MKLIKVHLHDDGGEKLYLYNLEIHPDMVSIFIEHGIIEAGQEHITAEEFLQLKKIMRLRKALGVNTNGAAIIAELLNRIEEMEDEIRILRRQLGAD